MYISIFFNAFFFYNAKAHTFSDIQQTDYMGTHNTYHRRDVYKYFFFKYFIVDKAYSLLFRGI